MRRVATQRMAMNGSEQKVVAPTVVLLTLTHRLAGMVRCVAGAARHTAARVNKRAATANKKRRSGLVETSSTSERPVRSFRVRIEVSVG